MTAVVGEIWVSGRNVAAGYHNRPRTDPRDVPRKTRPATTTITCVRAIWVSSTRVNFLSPAESRTSSSSSGRNIYPQDVETTAVVLTQMFCRRGIFDSRRGSEQLCVVAEVRIRGISQRSCTRDRRSHSIQRHRRIRRQSPHLLLSENEHSDHNQREGASAGGRRLLLANVLHSEPDTMRSIP